MQLTTLAPLSAQSLDLVWTPNARTQTPVSLALLCCTKVGIRSLYHCSLYIVGVPREAVTVAGTGASRSKPNQTKPES